MKKLVIRIKSWLHREDEAKKLYRIARYLCNKYGLKYGYLNISVEIRHHANAELNVFTAYRIYTDIVHTDSSAEYAKDFNLVVDMFELFLKEWKNGQDNRLEG